MISSNLNRFKTVLRKVGLIRFFLGPIWVPRLSIDSSRLIPVLVPRLNISRTRFRFRFPDLINLEHNLDSDFEPRLKQSLNVSILIPDIFTLKNVFLDKRALFDNKKYTFITFRFQFRF